VLNIESKGYTCAVFNRTTRSMPRALHLCFACTVVAAARRGVSRPHERTPKATRATGTVRIEVRAMCSQERCLPRRSCKLRGSLQVILDDCGCASARMPFAQTRLNHSCLDAQQGRRFRQRARQGQELHRHGSRPSLFGIQIFSSFNPSHFCPAGYRATLHNTSTDWTFASGVGV